VQGKQYNQKREAQMADSFKMFETLFPGRGEIGAFRGMKFLFDKSKPFREMLLQRLTECLGGNEGPVILQMPETPKMQLEVTIDPTIAHETYGRIDAVIRGENFLVAIEGKFGAIFQLDQPERYREWVENQPEQHKALIVIVPENRLGQIPVDGGNEIARANLSWQEIWAGLSQYELKDLSLHVIQDEWVDFLKDLCQDYDWAAAPQCFGERDTSVDAFLVAAYELLRDERYDFVHQKLDPWGYSRGYRLFDRSRSSRLNAWFGVVRNGSFEPDNRFNYADDCFLITLATDFEVAIGPTEQQLIRMRTIQERNWRHERHFYVIDPSQIRESDRSRAGWEMILKPFREAFVQQCQG